jgi:hypothetical protein
LWQLECFVASDNRILGKEGTREASLKTKVNQKKRRNGKMKELNRDWRESYSQPFVNGKCNCSCKLS